MNAYGQIEDTGSDAAELRRLEESLLDAAIRRDGNRLRDLLAEDFVEFGSSGRVWSRKTIIDFLAAETGFKAPAIHDFDFRPLDRDVALVTYRTERIDDKSGARLISLRSSIWKRHDGSWRMVFHQGTRTG